MYTVVSRPLLESIVSLETDCFAYEVCMKIRAHFNAEIRIS